MRSHELVAAPAVCSGAAAVPAAGQSFRPVGVRGQAFVSRRPDIMLQLRSAPLLRTGGHCTAPHGRPVCLHPDRCCRVCLSHECISFRWTALVTTWPLARRPWWMRRGRRRRRASCSAASSSCSSSSSSSSPSPWRSPLPSTRASCIAARQLRGPPRSSEQGPAATSSLAQMLGEPYVQPFRSGTQLTSVAV